MRCAELRGEMRKMGFEGEGIWRGEKEVGGGAWGMYGGEERGTVRDSGETFGGGGRCGNGWKWVGRRGVSLCLRQVRIWVRNSSVATKCKMMM